MKALKTHKDKYISVFFKVVDSLKYKEIISKKELLNRINEFLSPMYKLKEKQLPFLFKYQRKYIWFKSIYGSSKNLNSRNINYIFVEAKKWKWCKNEMV